MPSPKEHRLRDLSLQILSVDDSNKLIVNKENVDEIVQRLNKADVSKLSIISIAGSFRTGKSFILNLMVKYLIHHEGKTLTETTEWCSGMVSKHEYFQWSPGVHRKTLGIWMYTRPFVRIINGTRVGIVFMDTQGLWDGESGYGLLTSIFGMSSIISSVQVYNLMRTIELDKLDQIKWFTGFGEGAIQRCFHKEGMEPTPVFQTLHLLVRDWVGFTDVTNPDVCRDETMHFLDSQKKQKEFNKFITELENVYMTVDAVLLPPPGATCCFDAEFHGMLTAVDSAFLECATRYFHNLFSKPIIKQFNGNPVVPNALREIVLRFTDIFHDAYIPESLSFAGAMLTTVNMCARESAHCSYRRSMVKFVSSGSTPLNLDDLERLHYEIRSKTLTAFSRSATYGGAADVDIERVKLKESIDISYGEMKLRNKENQRRGLNVYTPYVTAAIVTMLVDKSSDVVCDWWSSSCRDLSGALFSFYGYGFILMIGLIARFNFKNGNVLTIQAIMELGDEVQTVFVRGFKHILERTNILFA